jgi:hypothetical protein
MTRDDQIELGASPTASRTAAPAQAGRSCCSIPGTGLDGSVFFPEVLTLTEAGVVAFDLPANGRSPAGAVLAIAGEHDRMPRALQQRIADASPRGTLAVIGGTGHFPFAEAPDRYWPAVARWLQESPAD